MTSPLNRSMQHNQTFHEKSRLDNIIPQNQELINNLNLKIDRRINNGYYFQVATKRKTLPIPNRYKFQPKIKPKKVHPIIKKPKKISTALVIQMRNCKLSINSKIQIKWILLRTGKTLRVCLFSKNPIPFQRTNKCSFHVKLHKYSKEINPCNGQLSRFSTIMKKFNILFKVKSF